MKMTGFLIIMALWSFTNSVAAQENCGRVVKGSAGPYDYRHSDAISWSGGGTGGRDAGEIAQGRLHFAPQVENLQRGMTGSLVGDIHYTLRQWPNHHRALLAVARYQLEQPERLRRELAGSHFQWGFNDYARCYFERALQFAPDDASVYMIYGVFLHRSGKFDEALAKYEIAEKMRQNWAELYYNMGLLYFEKKNYKAAQEYASKAYRLGYPLPGLRNKLKQVGIGVAASQDK